MTNQELADALMTLAEHCRGTLTAEDVALLYECAAALEGWSDVDRMAAA